VTVVYRGVRRNRQKEGKEVGVLERGGWSGVRSLSYRGTPNNVLNLQNCMRNKKLKKILQRVAPE